MSTKENEFQDRVIFVEGEPPSSPQTSGVRFGYIDTDGLFKTKDSNGNIEIYLPQADSAKVTHSVDQAISSGTLTTLNFDTSIYNYGGMYDSGVTDRFTVQKAGIYNIKTNFSFDANSTGVRVAYIEINGDNANRLGSIKLNAPNSGLAFLPLSIDAELTAGDYVSIDVYQDSGGSLNVLSNTTGIRSPIFSIRRVR